jgi:nucleoside 2-deoxyribosyltransferase
MSEQQVLKGKRAYLSGPIEHSDGKDWRAEPKNVLINQFGIDLFDPYVDPKQQWAPMLVQARQEKNYAEMQRIAHDFLRKDLSLVDHSDLIIAYLPRNVATVGTVHEIIVSNTEKKPTLLICPEGKEFISFWYYGFIPLDFMFGSWEELYQYLREVNEGKHKKNDRWAYIYGVI